MTTTAINFDYSDLAQQISAPNTTLEGKEVIYELVKNETNNFTIYPSQSYYFIKIILENGLIAKKALHSKSLLARVKDISSTIVEHPLISLATVGASTGIFYKLTKDYIWTNYITVAVFTFFIGMLTLGYAAYHFQKQKNTMSTERKSSETTEYPLTKKQEFNRALQMALNASLIEK